MSDSAAMQSGRQSRRRGGGMGDEVMTIFTDIEVMQIMGRADSLELRAESAEARADELLHRLEDAQAYAGKLEASLNAAHVYLDESPVNGDADDTPKELADRIALIVNELIELRTTVAIQAQKLEELGKAYDRMRDTVMDLTP